MENTTYMARLMFPFFSPPTLPTSVIEPAVYYLSADVAGVQVPQHSKWATIARTAGADRRY